MGLLSKRFNTDAGNEPNYSKRSSLILPDEVVTVSPTADVTPSYRESDNAVPGLTILSTLYRIGMGTFLINESSSNFSSGRTVI